jgi:hypothetical protein
MLALPKADLLSLTNHNIHCLGLAAAQNINGRGFTYDVPIQADKELIVMKDGIASNRNQNITNDQPAFGGGAVLLDTHNQKAGRLRTLESIL